MVTNLPFYVSFMITVTVQVSCQILQAGNGVSLPEFINYMGVDNNDRLPVHHQAIIYTYSFTSCGNITEWGADLHTDRTLYSLDFQVWRPSPTVNDSTGTGCYSLVGNNRFTSISLNSGLAIVTPSPKDYIQFQPQDVLGFYIESASIRPSGDIPNGLVLQTTPTIFTSELVLYASIAPTMATSERGDCPYSAGVNGVLDTSTHAAPVISVGATTFSCGLSSFLQTTSPFIATSTSGNSEMTETTRFMPVEYTMPHQTTTNMGPIDTSNAPVQTPHLVIGTVTAAVVVVVVILSLVVIIALCFLKGKTVKGVQSPTRPNMFSDYENFYANPIEDPTQTNYSEAVGDCRSIKSIDTITNEAYVMNKSTLMSIETSQNIAYLRTSDMMQPYQYNYYDKLN